MATGMRAAWKRVREFGAGSFFKGAVVTAVAVIGVSLLVGGYMGATGSLEVGHSLVTTFEEGAGAFISKAVEFLSSSLGLATMAAGGAGFLASDIIQNQKMQAALESERLALEYERARQEGKDRSKQRETSSTRETRTETRHESRKETRQPAPAPVKAHGGLDENGIYVKGSVIKNEKFCAAELKRRTERETRIETVTV